MKKLPKVLVFCMVAFVGFAAAHPSFAAPLTVPFEKVKLPNAEWTWGKPDKDASTTRIMYPIKTGQAVNLRVHTYDVPVSAQSFLDQVRANLASRDDYKGAEIRLMTTQNVGGTTWDVFEVKRKDEISQEIWGRKTDPNVVLMLIYTGAGTYFKDYYPQFKDFVKTLS